MQTLCLAETAIRALATCPTHQPLLSSGTTTGTTRAIRPRPGITIRHQIQARTTRGTEDRLLALPLAMAALRQVSTGRPRLASTERRLQANTEHHLQVNTEHHRQVSTGRLRRVHLPVGSRGPEIIATEKPAE
jgi:hypothetical protein